MTDALFQEQLREAMRRVGDLKSRAAMNPGAELVPAALEELTTALEELQVSEEELRVRTEELAVTSVRADAERNRYQDLFEFAPLGYLVTDPEANVIEANRAAVDLLWVPARRLAGKPLVLFVAEADRPRFHDELTRLLRGELSREFTLRVRPRGEESPERVVVFGVTAQREPNTGRVVLCWQLRDVTEQWEAERQVRSLNERLEQRVRERTAELETALRDRQELLESERASRTRAEGAERRLRAESHQKDEFLALLAHELRGPMGPIRQAGQVLGRADAPEAAAAQARQIIKRQVTHMARLVDDLLDAARIARGRVTLSRERLDLAALVRSVVEDRREGLEHDGLTLGVSVPDAPIWIEGDAVRLAQVLGNLLHNACKFTERGRVTVRLRQREGQARVEVEDTGAGIAAEVLPRVFEMFSRGEEPGEKAAGGLGLGLALVQGLVVLHGGTVQAHSDGPGRGAMFVFELPPAAGPAAASHTAPEPSQGRRRVLVIEDNRDAADTLAVLLRAWGHEARVAYNGAEGVRAAVEFRPDVVLCDLALPGLSGFEVARRLRNDPATASCRLVAASGFGREVDRNQATDAGFEDHLTKPVDLDHLRRLVSVARPAAG